MLEVTFSPLVPTDASESFYAKFYKCVFFSLLFLHFYFEGAFNDCFIYVST